MKLKLVMILVSTMALSSCTTLNKDECLIADWYQIGYEDGARGYSDTRITSHRKACAKHGIAPDFRAYQDGHEEGVIRFCNPQNGFSQGKDGYNYSGICPASLEDGFLDGYNAGYQIYAAASALITVQNEQRSNENNIDRLQQELIDAEALMFAAETPEDERRNIFNSIALKQEELGALEERNKQVIVEITEAESRLRILENKYTSF